MIVRKILVKYMIKWENIGENEGLGLFFPFKWPGGKVAKIIRTIEAGRNETEILKTSLKWSKMMGIFFYVFFLCFFQFL